MPNEDANEHAFKRYDRDYQRFLKAEKHFEKQEKALKDLYTKIYSSVDTRYYMNFKENRTVYTALKTLKRHFSPTTEGREKEIRREYQTALTKKIGNVKHWLADFTKVYQEALEYQLPDVQGIRALLDLLDATEAITPAFSSQLRTNVILGEKYEIVYVVSKFREAARYERRFKKGASHSASTGQQEKTDDKDSKESKGTKKPCLCGISHRWIDCYYPEAVKANDADINDTSSDKDKGKELAAFTASAFLASDEVSSRP